MTLKEADRRRLMALLESVEALMAPAIWQNETDRSLARSVRAQVRQWQKLLTETPDEGLRVVLRNPDTDLPALRQWFIDQEWFQVPSTNEYEVLRLRSSTTGNVLVVYKNTAGRTTAYAAVGQTEASDVLKAWIVANKERARG
jgi:hypothetical protein